MNVHAVFPTPPVGLMTATMFARVTPGMREQALLELRLLLLGARDQQPLAAPVQLSRACPGGPGRPSTSGAARAFPHRSLRRVPAYSRSGLPDRDPVLVELPQPVHLTRDLRRAGAVAEQVGGDRPQGLAALDGVEPVAGRGSADRVLVRARHDADRHGVRRAGRHDGRRSGDHAEAGRQASCASPAARASRARRCPHRGRPTRPARARRSSRSSAGGAAGATGSDAGSVTAAGSSLAHGFDRAAPRQAQRARRLHRPVLGLRHRSRRLVLRRRRPAVGPPGRRLVEIRMPGSGLATTSAEPSMSWSGPAATAAAGAPIPENASRPAAIAACVRRDTISSPVERAGQPIATADRTARVERQPGMILRQP